MKGRQAVTGGEVEVKKKKKMAAGSATVALFYLLPTHIQKNCFTNTFTQLGFFFFLSNYQSGCRSQWKLCCGLRDLRSCLSYIIMTTNNKNTAHWTQQSESPAIKEQTKALISHNNNNNNNNQSCVSSISVQSAEASWSHIINFITLKHLHMMLWKENSVNMCFKVLSLLIFYHQCTFHNKRSILGFSDQLWMKAPLVSQSTQ